MDRYFIEKQGYSCNPPKTYDQTDLREYWSGTRLRMCMEYQYDVYKAARRECRKRQSRRILDLGSGPPRKLHYFFHDVKAQFDLADQPNTKELATEYFPEARFHSVDLNEEVGKLSSEPFDLVISADVIEHLARPDCLMRCICQNLADWGVAIISTPNRDVRRGLSNLRPDNPVHVREWNLREFRNFV